MKSLDQIASHGIAINATNTPADAGDVFVIAQPGNYYLAGNLTVPNGKNGIKVMASNVTIDMNGFEIAGAVSGFSGIYIPAATQCVVKNGAFPGGGGDGIYCAATNSQFSNLTFSNCYDGIGFAAESAIVTNCVAVLCSDHGFNTAQPNMVFTNCAAHRNLLNGFQSSSDCTMSNCVANFNGGTGIAVGNSSTLNNCTAKANNAYGFSIGGTSSVTDCTAVSNISGGFNCGNSSAFLNCNGSFNNGNGFTVGDNCSLTACNASANNHGGATSGSGIFAGNYCNITECTASGNPSYGIHVQSNNSVLHSTAGGNVIDGIHTLDGCTVSQCDASGNSDYGINTNSGCTVSNCTTRANTFHGIVVNAECLVVGNVADRNGASGIRPSGSANRLENNSCTYNTLYGINIDSVNANNLLIRNTARGNTNGNYLIQAGNNCNVVLATTNPAVISGNSGGTQLSTDPTANLAY
jgi:parallel beta-helix repeat protein